MKVLLKDRHSKSLYLFVADVSRAFLRRFDRPNERPQQPLAPLVIRRYKLELAPGRTLGIRVKAAIFGPECLKLALAYYLPSPSTSEEKGTESKGQVPG